MIKLGIKKLRDDVELPKYAHTGDACFDIRVVVDEKDIWGEKQDRRYIRPHESYTFRTGLAFDIPEGYMLAVHPRSGLGIKHNIVLSNCTGIIDSCYVDELRVGLINQGTNVFEVTNGMRVAQAMLVPVPQVVIEEVDEIPVKSRGLNSGLGSSGVN